MGAYSTVTITRDEAISRICDAVGGATNAELSEAFFALTANHVLDNYTVVGEEPEPQKEYMLTDVVLPQEETGDADGSPTTERQKR